MIRINDAPGISLPAYKRRVRERVDRIVQDAAHYIGAEYSEQAASTFRQEVALHLSKPVKSVRELEVDARDPAEVTQ